MTVAELIRANESLLKIMANNGVTTDIVRHLEMFADYDRLIKEGHKKTYVVQYLSEQYDLNERRIYRIIRVMQKTVVFKGV